MTLGDLPAAHAAIVVGFQTDDPSLETRLREIGFAEGDRVECLYFGLFGKNPITVRLNNDLVAMRRNEAAAVIVETQNG